MLKQFEIWLTDLEPRYGSEQGGKRPVLIAETNAVYGNGNTTIVIPLSSQIERVFPFDVIITPNKKNGLNKKSKLMFRQLRVIDKKRFKKKMGTLEEEYREAFVKRLQILFDLKGSFIGA